MLYELKKRIGAFSIRLIQKVQSIRVAFKLKRIRQRIQQDASTMTKLEHWDNKNLLHASKPDIQAHIQKFLETPEGRLAKAEMSVRLADEYLEKITLLLQQPDLNLNQKLLFSLALQECVETLQQNQQIMNSMMQSKSNETF